MDFNIEGPWELSKLEDNAYKVFAYIHQRHCIPNHEQFLYWLKRLVDCEKSMDFNKLVELRRDIIMFEQRHINRGN